jgi:hypothetical protein
MEVSPLRLSSYSPGIRGVTILIVDFPCKSTYANARKPTLSDSA